jgi:oligopeptidase A
VLPQGGAPRAYFYRDPYSRPAETKGGAWMAEVRVVFFCARACESVAATVCTGFRPAATLLADPPGDHATIACACALALQVVGRTKLLPPAKGSPPGSPRLPVAHMVCNQSPPVDGQPSLMTFRCAR